MSNTELIRQVEPLVFSDDPECVSSPKLLSPADSSYCGTMKSDDSGIVMDDSHNFSMSSSDHERDVELNFTSAEVSPLEEENEFVQSTNRDVSASPECVEEPPVKVVDLEKKQETCEAIEEFFRNSVNLEEYDVLENPDEIKDEDKVEESAEESEPVSQNHISPNTQELSASEEEIKQSDDVTNLQQTDDQSELTEESHDQETESTLTNDDVLEQNIETETETEVVEELIEKQAVEEKEEEMQIEEPQLEEPEQPKEEEEERVDFVKEEEPEEPLFDPGIKCDDAYTALDILKTKYRLSDTSVFRKFIITFSSWNVSQISHPMASGNRCSWWDDDIKDEELAEEDPQVDELMEQIYSRQGEISDLVDRIMEQEAEKIRAQKAEQEPVVSASKPPAQTESPEAIVPCEEAITPVQETVPESQSAPINPDNKTADKKKNRNALRRFIHAMRKRLRRNRPPAEANRKAT